MGRGNLGKMDQCIKLYYFSANVQNKIKSFEENYDKVAFTKNIEYHLNLEQQKIHNRFSEYFKTSVNRIWLYGDKHENMIPILSVLTFIFL